MSEAAAGHPPRPRRIDAIRDWFERQREERPVPFWSVVGVLATGLLAFFLVAATFVHDYRSAAIPPVGEAALQPPTILLDVQGDELGQLDPAVVGEEVSSEELPDHVVAAVLAAEDQDFWGHQGFSIRGTVRAAWQNLRNATIEQGASTITQQYVDLTTEGSGRSVRAKMREVAAAVRFEDTLGKREVLDRYLNVVPFGRSAVGIDQAARVYFRVPAGELDLNQAATLAGIIAAPTAYDPERNPEGAQRRRDVVLSAMVESGWVDASEADEVQSSSLPEIADESLVQFGSSAYVVDAVRRQLQEELGAAGLGRGLVVHTTIDSRMQEAAQATVREHVQDQPYTGAVVTVDPNSGEVRALVGGADFATEQYNAAVRARRQAGSAFKTFTLTAFVEEGWSPSRSRFDAPAELEVESGGETIQVANYGDRGFGELTVEEATVNSVNTVYMQMAEFVGPTNIVSTAHEMGIESDIPSVPSITLGTGSVTPLEMASAYATLPARGIHHDTTLIRRVENLDGEVLFESEVSGERVISERTAGVVTGVLEDVVERGTGTAAQLDRPVAGKTGTTDDGRDAWFVGFTAQLTTAVWIGKADNTPMEDATGGGLAAPLWHDYMAEATAPLDVVELPTVPEGDLEALDERDDTSPSPSPTASSASESPSPSDDPTDGDPSEDEPTDEPSEPDDASTPPDPPSPSESDTTSSPTPTTSETSSPSPTPTTSDTSSPSPTPTTSDTSSPSPSPTTSESPSPDSSPSPTETSSTDPVTSEESPSPTDSPEPTTST